MRQKQYYSVRAGKSANLPDLNLPDILFLFHEVYRTLSQDGYFQEVLGFRCDDPYGSAEYV